MCTVLGLLTLLFGPIHAGRDPRAVAGTTGFPAGRVGPVVADLELTHVRLPTDDYAGTFGDAGSPAGTATVDWSR